ncbi:MAG: hypothetical protein JWR50_473 [Mucilaginibacter sp.]|nr:hypothetical protein [Mucilaginibacter sp.]
MEKYSKIWRLFYAVAIIGIAIQQLVVGMFMPVIIPPGTIFISDSMACVWVVRLLLLSASLVIIISDKYARAASLLIGGFLLLLFLVLHLPFQLKTNLHFLAGWSDALKILALSGGAFVVASSIPPKSRSVKTIPILQSFIPLGRFFFAVDLLVAGIMHFMYMSFVAMLVPAWIPWHTFWGYLAGVALIAGALGIILNIQLKLAANLLGIIIFIWLITLHIPRAIADPVTGHGNEIVSVFEALGFSGIAFLIAGSGKKTR